MSGPRAARRCSNSSASSPALSRLIDAARGLGIRVSPNAQRDGCLISNSDAAAMKWLTPRAPSYDDSTLGKGVTALARGRRRGALLARTGQLLRIDGEGKTIARQPPALIACEDGTFELLEGDKHPAVGRRSSSSAAVEGMVEGPAATVALGFADGTFGSWDRSDGRRLVVSRLHGPISHLLLQGHRPHAVSELGDHRVEDLSALETRRCDLLAELWKQIPVVWQAGRQVTAGSQPLPVATRRWCQAAFLWCALPSQWPNAVAQRGAGLGFKLLK